MFNFIKNLFKEEVYQFEPYVVDITKVHIFPPCELRREGLGGWNPFKYDPEGYKLIQLKRFYKLNALGDIVGTNRGFT